MVGIRDNGCYFAFDTAYDQEFAKYSPGAILHNMLLEQLFSKGVKRFDFGYIADYKKRWTENALITKDVVIFPQGFLGSAFWLTHRLKANLKRIFVHSHEQEKDDS